MLCYGNIVLVCLRSLVVDLIRDLTTVIVGLIYTILN